MALSKAGLGWAAAIGSLLVVWTVAFVELRPKAPVVHAVVCQEAITQNFDYSGLSDTSFVVRPVANCFGGWVVVPKSWKSWSTDQTGGEPGKWHAYWFANDPAPLGPFYPDNRDIVGRPAHTPFRVEGHGAILFHTSQAEGSAGPGPGSVKNEAGGSQGSGQAGSGTAAAPAYGANLYGMYCEDCHGRDGKAPGPQAKRRNLSVPDLQLLTTQNRGVFPLRKVETLLSGTSQAPMMHGGIEMPAWGEVLAHGGGGPDATQAEAAHALARYLESLQSTGPPTHY